MKKYRIAATVVLYQPDSSLSQNIKTYLNEVEILYVIDNSEQSAADRLGDLREHPKVRYFKNAENLGIAAALNRAAEWAMSSSFDFLLTMDQDSRFTLGQCSLLATRLEGVDSSKVGILSPVHGHPTQNDQTRIEVTKEVDFVMTSGNLLNLLVYKHSGPFLEKLFIDHVDHEYCLRMRSLGYKVMVCNDIVLDHALGTVKRVGVLNFTFFTFVSHQPLRTYYMVRNGLYVARLYRTFAAEFFKLNRRLIRMEILKILFEDQRIKRMKMIWLAIRDYKNLNMGKFDTNRLSKTK